MKTKREIAKDFFIWLVSASIMIIIYSYLGPYRDSFLDSVFGTQIWHYIFN